MNREILFRIKSGNKWIYGLPLKITEKTIAFEGVLEDGSTYYDALCEKQTLGQFTGITDKKGKKIFEGDIVELIVIGGYRHKRYKVFYDNETAQWLMKNGEGIDDCDKFYGQQVRCNMIVIGNIFDNPDLLEEV